MLHVVTTCLVCYRFDILIEHIFSVHLITLLNFLKEWLWLVGHLVCLYSAKKNVSTGNKVSFVF